MEPPPVGYVEGTAGCGRPLNGDGGIVAFVGVLDTKPFVGVFDTKHLLKKKDRKEFKRKLIQFQGDLK